MNTHTRTTARRPWIALVAAIVAVALAGFLVGRRTAGSGAQTTVQLSEGQPEVGHGEAGVITFSSDAAKLAHIQTAPVSYSPVQAPLPVTGVVEPNLGGVVKVTPRVAGKITSVAENVGDNVRAGQTLATLSSADLAQAQAAYAQATSRVAVAAGTVRRQRKLASLGAFGRPPVEEARGQAVTARGEEDTAQSEVAAARSEVVEADSERTALQAALSQAQTQAQVAQARLQRAQTLLKEEIVSRQDFEQAQADAQRAQADVEAARANLAKGQAGGDTANARLRVAQAKFRTAGQRSRIASQARAREEAVYRGGYSTSREIVEAEASLRHAQLEQQAVADQIRLLGGRPGGGDQVAITAPLSGRVTERTISLGETVTPERTVFTIVNLNTVWVQLSVYQKDLPTLRTGQRVAVTSDTAPGRRFAGIVSYIGDVVDETTRAVKVRAVIQNSNGSLKPGTYVRGTIATDGRTRGITVPRNAVQTMEGKPVVFVQGDLPGEFTKRDVETGNTANGRTVIAGGLKPGERIVVEGAFTVKAQAMKAELVGD